MNVDTFENQGSFPPAHSISCTLSIGGLLLPRRETTDSPLVPVLWEIPSGHLNNTHNRLLVSLSCWPATDHFSPDKSCMEHVLSSCWQFLHSSRRAGQVKGRGWKGLFPAPVCFSYSKGPIQTDFERKAQPSNTCKWPRVTPWTFRQLPNGLFSIPSRGNCLERGRVKVYRALRRLQY